MQTTQHSSTSTVPWQPSKLHLLLKTMQYGWKHEKNYYLYWIIIGSANLLCDSDTVVWKQARRVLVSCSADHKALMTFAFYSATFFALRNCLLWLSTSVFTSTNEFVLDPQSSSASEKCLYRMNKIPGCHKSVLRSEGVQESIQIYVVASIVLESLMDTKAHPVSYSEYKADPYTDRQ